jgi:hypothetical protein
MHSQVDPNSPILTKEEVNGGKYHSTKSTGLTE